MAALVNEESLKAAHEAVTRQGDAVRAMKASLKEGKARKVEEHTHDCRIPMLEYHHVRRSWRQCFRLLPRQG